MLKKYKNIFNNTYTSIAAVLAMVLSPLADAIGGNYAFPILTAILFVLFFYGLYQENKKIKKFKSDTIHIPIIIKIDEGPSVKYVMKNLLKQIEKDYSFNNYDEDLKKYFSIDTDTLTFEYKGDIYNFNHLMNFTWIIKYKLNEIEQQLDGKVKFHIAYYKRPSVGFLIGTLFRTEGIVIYQNNDYEDTFEKVANINSRQYKEKISNFTKYKVIENIQNKNESNILVVINSASHKVNLRAKSLKKYKSVITVHLVENGTIPYESDWTIYANEIYNILNDLQTRYDNITIAHSMPEAIAVILGMGLENYWNIHITQYADNDYKNVFTMSKIKYYT